SDADARDAGRSSGMDERPAHGSVAHGSGADPRGDQVSVSTLVGDDGPLPGQALGGAAVHGSSPSRAGGLLRTWSHSRSVGGARSVTWATVRAIRPRGLAARAGAGRRARPTAAGDEVAGRYDGGIERGDSG